MSSPPQKTYTGGCHCSFLRYSLLTADISTAQFTKCNCTICHKINRLSLSVPRSALTILSPTNAENTTSSDNESEGGSINGVPSYTFGSGRMTNYFCSKCGIHCFSSGSYEWEGKLVQSFSVNAVTLDADQGVDFRAVKTVYWDGLHDNWTAGSADKPYEGGCF